MRVSSEEVGRIGAELFGNTYLCAESVLVAIAQWRGVESELIPGIATGFCSGMARTCDTCGVVTAGIMALGLCCEQREPGESPDALYALVQDFKKQFLEKHGSINCRELTGLDLSTDAGKAAYKEQDCYGKCRTYVADACMIVAELVEAREKSKE